MQTHLKSVRPIKFVRVYVYVELPQNIYKMASMHNDLPNLDETIANVAFLLSNSNVKEEQLKVIRSFIQKNDELVPPQQASLKRDDMIGGFVRQRALSFCVYNIIFTANTICHRVLEGCVKSYVNDYVIS